MKEQLLQWAQAGDGDCMLKLSKIYFDEGNTAAADEWLAKAAATKNFFAMKIYADQLRRKGELTAARELYREVISSTFDTESLEALVDLSEDDAETLQFVLDTINCAYNEIYLRDYQILQRIMSLGTRRHNECTIQTLEAVEHRRIASRIRKILSAN